MKHVDVCSSCGHVVVLFIFCVDYFFAYSLINFGVRLSQTVSKQLQ